MENKKMLIIVNPNSGKAKMRGKLLDVCEIFSNAGFDITVYPTKCRNDATERALQIKQDEFDVVVVSGGDGTLNEVVTGLLQTGIKVTLGYIPSGTLNEWSSSLNISRDIKTAAKDIVDGQIVSVDMGKFGDKYFSYTASFGAFTEVSYSTPQGFKNTFGHAAYILEGVKSVANIKSQHLKVIFDGKEVEGDYLFGAVSNSFSLGGMIKFKQNVVNLNDGYFELVLIQKPKNLLTLQKILDGIIKKDFNRKGIEFFHAKEFTIIGGDDLSWTLDGEYCAGSHEVSVSAIPSAISLLVPNNEKIEAKAKKKKTAKNDTNKDEKK